MHAEAFLIGVSANKKLTNTRVVWKNIRWSIKARVETGVVFVVCLLGSSRSKKEPRESLFSCDHTHASNMQETHRVCTRSCYV